MPRNDGNASRNRKLRIKKVEKEDSFERFINEFNQQQKKKNICKNFK